jgi:hypothetical protein
MLRRVALVRTDVSEKLTRATRRNVPEEAILHSHRRENLKFYGSNKTWKNIKIVGVSGTTRISTFLNKRQSI